MQLGFVVTNLGPGSGNAVVDLIRVAPSLSGKTETTTYRWPVRVKADDWHASKHGVDIRTTLGTLKRTERGYTATVRIWGYDLDITVRSTGPNYKPGSGTVAFPGGGRFDVQLAPVAARFTARERTHGGAWQTFKGTAWLEHGATNVSPERLSNHFLRFHGRAGTLAVAFMELETGPAFEFASMGWLVVADGKKIVASVLNPKVEVLKSRSDRVQKDGPKRSGHRIPTTYRVSGVAEGSGKPIELRVVVGKSLYRDDVLEALPRWLRAIVRTIVQPLNFTHAAKFQVKGAGSRKQGSGTSLYSPMRTRR